MNIALALLETMQDPGTNQGVINPGSNDVFIDSSSTLGEVLFVIPPIFDIILF